MKAIVIGTGFGAAVMAPALARVGISPRVVSPRDDAAVRSAMAANVDLMSIHSPPFLHHQHVMMALDQGHAVLCDKPFGRNAEEAVRMADRARELGLPNFVNFENRFHPARQRAKQLLDVGAIGSLEHVSWTMFGNGLRNQRHGWLFDLDLAGGWIGAYGAHCIDALHWLTGSEIARSGGMARIEIASRPGRDGRQHPSTAEDAYSIWFELANGVTASMDSGYCSSVMLPERILLLGTDGSLELVGNRTLVLTRPDEAAEAFEFPAPAGDSYAPAMVPWLAAVRDAVRSGGQIAPSFDDGLANTRAMDKLRAAILRLGRPGTDR